MEYLSKQYDSHNNILINIKQQEHLICENESIRRQLEDMYRVDSKRLLYKQTIRFDSIASKLKLQMDHWYQVLEQWQQFTIRTTQSTIVPFIFHQHHAMDDEKNKNRTTKVSLSTHSLIQIASISPLEAHQWIQQLLEIYKSQWHCKKMLYLSLQAIDSENDLLDILTQWNNESYLKDQPLFQDITDRLNLYKQIKRTLEAV
ncbi:unnamed protein product [Cunninghamella blakesleeana]